MIKYLATDDSKCVGCMNCTATCSQKYFKVDDPAKSCIRVEGLGGNKFHLVACDQECRKCVQECPTKALIVGPTGIVVLNKSLCVGCLACVAVCPIEAMRFFPGDKNPFKCIACGSCVPSCPKDALSIKEKPDSEKSLFYKAVEEAVKHGASGQADVTRVGSTPMKG
ncbi:MAG: 4Fe-4S binding protein [Treponema sp.]|nr:4Fe-4S binding protein [Treponema sp.]